MNYCKNYRQNAHGLRYCGSNGTQGTVLADLYSDKECTNFIRVAVVADCRTKSAAIKYANEKNKGESK